MLVSAVVRCREGVRPLQAEGTRSRQTVVLLRAVHMVRADLHIRVTVVRGAGCRVRHTGDVVGEAVGISEDDRVGRLGHRQDRIHRVLEDDALRGGTAVAAAVGRRVDDVIRTLARLPIEGNGGLGRSELDIVAEGHIAVGLECSERAVARAEGDVVDEQPFRTGVRLQADVQLGVIVTIEVECREVPLALDAEVVDVLVVGVDQVNLTSIGHHPDADPVTRLPSGGLREVIEGKGHPTLTDIHIVKHHFHDAVRVLQLEALAAIREGAHDSGEGGHTHIVTVGQTNASCAVVVAGEAHLTTGRREVHIGLTGIVRKSVVHRGIAGIDVLATRSRLLETRTRHEDGLVTCGQVEVEEVTGRRVECIRHDVRSRSVGHLNGLDVGNRGAVAVVVGHRDGPHPLEGVATRGSIARRLVGIADVDTVEVRLRSRRSCTGPVSDERRNVCCVLGLVRVVVGTTAGRREVAVHGPSGLVPCTAVRIRVGTGTQGDAVLELVTGTRSILSNHTEHIDDVGGAVHDGDLVVTVAVCGSAGTGHDVRSESVASREAGVVRDPGIVARGKRADAAQVNVAAQGRTGVAVGPTLQYITREVDVTVSTVVDLHEAAGRCGVVRVTDGRDDQTARRDQLSHSAEGVVSETAAVVLVIGSSHTRAHRGRIEVTVVIICVQDGVSREVSQRNVRADGVQEVDRVARGRRRFVAAVVHQGHRVGPQDVVAAHSIDDARVGRIVCMGEAVRHIAVAVVRGVHQEPTGITGDRMRNLVGGAILIEEDRQVSRSISRSSRSGVVRDRDGLIDGLRRAVASAVRGGHREGARHDEAALIGGIVPGALEVVAVTRRVGHRHIIAVVGCRPRHGAEIGFGHVGRASVQCRIGRRRQRQARSHRIDHRDDLRGKRDVVSAVLRTERTVDGVSSHARRGGEGVGERHVHGRVTEVLGRSHLEVGCHIIRAGERGISGNVREVGVGVVIDLDHLVQAVALVATIVDRVIDELVVVETTAGHHTEVDREVGVSAGLIEVEDRVAGRVLDGKQLVDGRLVQRIPGPLRAVDDHDLVSGQDRSRGVLDGEGRRRADAQTAVVGGRERHRGCTRRTAEVTQAFKVVGPGHAAADVGSGSTAV